MDAGIVNYKSGIAYQEDIEQNSFDLHDQKIVERAKDILMRQRNLSEYEAYELLSTMAKKRNIKLIDVSNQLIETAKLLII
jgi:response regulator NasT